MILNVYILGVIATAFLINIYFNSSYQEDMIILLVSLFWPAIIVYALIKLAAKLVKAKFKI